MFLRRISGFGGNGGGGGAAAITLLVRHFSRERAPNLRKINPKVSPQEASSLAQDIYQVIKEHGPLTVSNAWNHVKEASISGLNSKTHMKIMLKWMRGRKMLKLWCHHVGSNKKFFHTTLPEDPHTDQFKNSLGLKLETEKPKMKKKKKKKSK